MGGYGSGRRLWYCKKDTVEDCREIDACRWMREGVLKAGVHQLGRCRWFRDKELTEEASSIGYEVCTLEWANPWLRLFYTITRTQQALDYRIQLTTTSPRFGGLRWWFVCPLVVGGRSCQRRVGKLYLPPGGRYYGCRHCYQLTYTSCQESHKYDGLYRLLARNTGYDLDTVKWVMENMGK